MPTYSTQTPEEIALQHQLRDPRGFRTYSNVSRSQTATGDAEGPNGLEGSPELR